MRGRAKGEQERIIVQAHQTAAMTGFLHSKGGLKPLEYYLRKMKTAAPPKGDATVLLTAEERAQLRQMRKKG